MKGLKIEDDTYHRLLTLKGVYVAKNMTETIETLMKNAGYSAEFFGRVRKLVEAAEE